MNFTVKMLPNEHWWGGTAEHGKYMPFTCETELVGSFINNAPNQTMPVYVSDKGRAIWSDKPFSFKISDGEFDLTGDGEFSLEEYGSTLRDAFIGVRAKHFPIDKRVLNRDFFKTVQYNTWIECLYDPTQEHVLKYAHDIIDNGFEPGILMIDEGWHGRYGIWDFDPAKFPEPKKMVDELHALGFKVMLWVVPWVCPDGVFFMENFIESGKAHKADPEKRLFIRQKGKVHLAALYLWWNGFSAMLNMENATDRDFLDSQLQNLIEKYGVDGFKFDGGNVGEYSTCVSGEPFTDATPHELNIAWNNFAAKYDYHEYKDTYGGAAHATIQRLSDRGHNWGNQSGLNSIIPNSICQGLIGYPFICPDMVGGGSWSDFKPGKPIDQELFVRWAQASAFFPMMQYSKAPWDCLDKEHCDLVIKAGKLHKSLSDDIIEMVSESEITGEPILRNLEYNYPNQNYAEILDQFMLGCKYLVAPVLEKGARERKVILPEGKWLCDDGKVYEGGEYVIPAPLDRLIYFKKI